MASFDDYWKRQLPPELPPFKRTIKPWEVPKYYGTGQPGKLDRVAMGYVTGGNKHEIPPVLLEELFGGSPDPTVRTSQLTRKNWKLLTAAGVVGLWALKPLSWFSGRDDNYNTIEGLRHGGLAQQKRREMTEFGSGWDPLRALLGKNFGRVIKIINL